eukprot:TRINITY_DN7544_c0_g1_i1.p1 TRINITY_DN7544_c0_g1~~TRINITY_DN7544_c0_g1_i1.p1  ORF type:complete len:115 (+),score=32.07 TRINITY_DN7544_c0_g1_i1:62-406(+)
MRLWDVLTGKNTLVNYSGIRNHATKGTQIGISANDKYVYHPNGKHISVYNILTGERKDILRGHFENVTCCVFHPLYEELYSGGHDDTILVWSPKRKLEENDAKILQDDQDNWSD